MSAVLFGGAGLVTAGVAFIAGLDPLVCGAIGATVGVAGALASAAAAAPSAIKVEEKPKPKKEKKVKGTGGKPLPQEPEPKKKAPKKASKKDATKAETVEVESEEDEESEAPKSKAAPKAAAAPAAPAAVEEKAQTAKAKKKAAQKAKAAGEKPAEKVVEKVVEKVAEKVASAKAAAKAEPAKDEKGKKGVAAPAKGAAPAKAAEVKDEGDKKKKKKNKKKKVEAAVSDEDEDEVAVVKPVEEQWEVQKGNKSSKQKKNDKLEEKADAVKAVVQHTLEVKIDSKFYGKVIGPEGATRQALADATGATIDIPKKGALRDTILVSGSKEAAEAAKQAILDLMNKGYTSVLDKDTTDDGVVIDSKLHGIVIGPGGANIKAIQTKTGVKINMPDRTSDSNKITVVGDAAAVRQAIAAIEELAQNGFSSLTHDSFIKNSLVVPGAQKATLIGAGGATIRDLQQRTGTKVNMGDTANGFTTVDIVGPAEGVTAARILIQQLLLPPAAVPVPEEWSQSATAAMVNVW